LTHGAGRKYQDSHPHDALHPLPFCAKPWWDENAMRVQRGFQLLGTTSSGGILPLNSIRRQGTAGVQLGGKMPPLLFPFLLGDGLLKHIEVGEQDKCLR